MKTFLSIALVPLFLSLSTIAQISDASRDEINRANTQFMGKFHAGDLDEALKAAKNVIEVATREVGATHIETANAHKNLGEIYRMKHKYGNAIEHLQKAYAIYDLDIVKNVDVIGRVLNSLGMAFVADGKTKAVEPIFLQAVAKAEKAFGAEAKQTLPSLRALTNFYANSKQYDKAEDIFLKRFIIFETYEKKNDDKGLSDVSDEHSCYMSQHFKGDENQKRDKAFWERLKSERVKRFGEETPPPVKNTIMGGVVNGKATSLPKPDYPQAARLMRLSGSASIKVLIDEEGNVISAKGYCGDPIFYAVCEDAARKSKFSPTTLSGKPVKVSGVITYNFSAR